MILPVRSLKGNYRFSPDIFGFEVGQKHCHKNQFEPDWSFLALVKFKSVRWEPLAMSKELIRPQQASESSLLPLRRNSSSVYWD